MKALLIPAAVLVLGIGQTAAAQPRPAPTAPSPNPAAVTAGAYMVESNHARVAFSVSHFGLSMWNADFGQVTGTAHFDPKAPAANMVDVSFPASSLTSINSKLDGELKDSWIEAGKFPTISFKSTKVTPTGAGKADVTGDLTLHGVTKPVTLHVSFLAGGNDMMGKYEVGFEATGKFKRSDFGVTKFLPGIGDEVSVMLSVPFLKAG